MTSPPRAFLLLAALAIPGAARADFLEDLLDTLRLGREMAGQFYRDAQDAYDREIVPRLRRAGRKPAWQRARPVHALTGKGEQGCVPATTTGNSSGSAFGGGTAADACRSASVRIGAIAAGNGPIPGPLGNLREVLGHDLPRAPEEVTPEVAHHILDALGYYQSGVKTSSLHGATVWIPVDPRLGNNDRYITRSRIQGVPDDRVVDYQRALRAVAHGASYAWPQRNVTLDTRLKHGGTVAEVLHASATRLAEALRANRDVPDWVVHFPEYRGLEASDAAFAAGAAGLELPALALPAFLGKTLDPHEKEAVLRAMVFRESSGAHWVGHRMRAAYSGEAGWTQQLYVDRHILGAKVERNEYDPADNLRGAADDLAGKARRWRRRRGLSLKDVLAAYNAGSPTSGRGRGYAASVLQSVRWILEGREPYEGKTRKAPPGAGPIAPASQAD